MGVFKEFVVSFRIVFRVWVEVFSGVSIGFRFRGRRGVYSDSYGRRGRYGGDGLIVVGYGVVGGSEGWVSRVVGTSFSGVYTVFIVRVRMFFSRNFESVFARFVGGWS